MQRLVRFAPYFLAALSLMALPLAWSSPIAHAASVPTITVSPASAAPGEQITLSGTGFPAGGQVAARLYSSLLPIAPGADLAKATQSDATGAFTVRSTVPLTLFGQGNRANLSVIPGTYTIVASGDPGITASTSFTVGAPATAGFLWGEVALDINGNGVREAFEPLATGGELVVTGIGQANPMRVRTDALGRFALVPVPAGSYTLSTSVTYRSAPWRAVGLASVSTGQATQVNLVLHPSAANSQPIPPPPVPAAPTIATRPPSPAPATAAAPKVIIPSQLPATGHGGMAAP